MIFRSDVILNKKKQRFITLNEKDNVCVALENLKKGERINGFSLKDNINSGFKFSNKQLFAGNDCIKYGSIIGKLSCDVEPGTMIHTNNLTFKNSDVVKKTRESIEKSETKKNLILRDNTFKGFVRENDEVATRNYIGVISTVNCANTVVDEVTNYFRYGSGKDLINSINKSEVLIDGVIPIKHNLGCAMKKDGTGHQLLRKTLEGYALHSNFCYVIVIGLGCEVNDMSYLGNHSPSIEYLTIQGLGGSNKSSKIAIEKINYFLKFNNLTSRVPVSLSHLKISLQCGGSDSFSGITANPLLGKAVDTIIDYGGTAILGETPEIYGAEHLIMNRAISNSIANKIKDKILWWERYTSSMGESINNNPSTGNLNGGISNIAEKSLGAVAKSGSRPLVDVIDYAEKIESNGFIFMDTPGYDPVSVTGHIAGGCNLVCFTTGRGSAFGSFPSPTLKISSNTNLYLMQCDDIDFNAGTLLDNSCDEDELTNLLVMKIIEIASGYKSKSEINGYGYNEFVPWHQGAVL